MMSQAASSQRRLLHANMNHCGPLPSATAASCKPIRLLMVNSISRKPDLPLNNARSHLFMPCKAGTNSPCSHLDMQHPVYTKGERVVNQLFPQPGEWHSTLDRYYEYHTCQPATHHAYIYFGNDKLNDRPPTVEGHLLQPNPPYQSQLTPRPTVSICTTGTQYRCYVKFQFTEPCNLTRPVSYDEWLKLTPDLSDLSLQLSSYHQPLLGKDPMAHWMLLADPTAGVCVSYLTRGRAHTMELSVLGTKLFTDQSAVGQSYDCPLNKNNQHQLTGTHAIQFHPADDGSQCMSLMLEFSNPSTGQRVSMSQWQQLPSTSQLPDRKPLTCIESHAGPQYFLSLIRWKVYEDMALGLRVVTTVSGFKRHGEPQFSKCDGTVELAKTGRQAS